MRRTIFFSALVLNVPDYGTIVVYLEYIYKARIEYFDKQFQASVTFILRLNSKYKQFQLHYINSAFLGE